jgi:hypothetical protein
MDGPGPSDPERPPDDPEAWSHEQWITWLAATDDPAAAARRESVRRWRPRRPTGVLGAAMLGLHDAIYGRPDDEVVVVADAGGDPPGDDLHDLRLDPDHPERSEVVVRRPGPATGAGPVPGPDADPVLDDQGASSRRRRRRRR